MLFGLLVQVIPAHFLAQKKAKDTLSPFRRWRTGGNQQSVFLASPIFPAKGLISKKPQALRPGVIRGCVTEGDA